MARGVEGWCWWARKDSRPEEKAKLPRGRAESERRRRKWVAGLKDGDGGMESLVGCCFGLVSWCGCCCAGGDGGVGALHCAAPRRAFASASCSSSASITDWTSFGSIIVELIVCALGCCG